MKVEAKRTLVFDVCEDLVDHVEKAIEVVYLFPH